MPWKLRENDGSEPKMCGSFGEDGLSRPVRKEKSLARGRSYFVFLILLPEALIHWSVALLVHGRICFDTKNEFGQS